MTTDRWHPSAGYSDSVRDQPATPTSATARAPATAAAPTTTTAPGYPDPLRDAFHLVSAHASSTGPTVSRASPSTSDIPVHPAINSRNHPPPALYSPPPARPAAAVEDPLSPPNRKRRCSATEYPPAKQPKPDCDLSSTPTTELSAPGPTQNASSVQAAQQTSLEQTNRSRQTRGSRACTVCRKLKMRCVGAEDGAPCKRCRAGKLECIFEESQRGKKGTKRTDLLAKNLQTVEEKLDAVMSEMKNQAAIPLVPPPNHPVPISPLGYSPPGLQPLGAYGLSQLANSTPAVCAAGSLESGPAATQHPSNSQVLPPDPTLQTASELGQAQQLTRFAALSDFSCPASPRLHSLPDNTLNPLGLLAEASLRNRHDRQRSDRSSSGSHRRNSSARRTAPVDANSTFSSDATKDLASGPSNQHVRQRSSSPSSSSSSSILQDRELSRPPSATHETHSRGTKTHKRKVGVANVSYFQPGPASFLPLRRIVIEQRMPPSLLTDKILTNEEVVELFDIFFENCNPHCCILEPKLHTPSMVGSRSPFLFTAICAVSSRYYEKRKELHLNCLQAAKRIAFDVMVKGYKSVEVVQAFLLLSLWNQPAERFEEDRTWAFSGIAIRMAIDLNLHRKTTLQLAPPNGGPPWAPTPLAVPQPDEAAVQQQEMCEREILNRERTWLYCFILDRSLSAQMGKPYSIREDFIIRSSKNWHKSRYSVAEDSGITAMVDLHRIHSRILDTLYSDTCSNSGLNANLDYSLLMKTFSQSLDQWMTECTLRIETSQHDLRGGYRQSMKDFYYNYYRLFTMSFMLQHTLENPDKEIELPQVYLTCYDAATRVITIARDRLGPLGALRYAPDNQFVYIAYAAVFLLKLIRPQFQSFCDRPAVRNLVHECTVLLDEVSVDETHTPALYAAFLRVLLNSKRDGSHSPTQAPLATEPSRADESLGVMGTGGPPEQSAQALADEARCQRAPAEGVEGGMELFYPDTPYGAKDAVAPFSQPIKQRAFEGFDVEASGSGEDYSTGPQQTGNDYFVDSLLKDGGFWDSMLMPGYSGPLDALSGGTGLVSQYGRNNGQDPGGLAFTSPSGSGRVTPNPVLYFDPHASGSTGNGGFGLGSGHVG